MIRIAAYSRITNTGLIICLIFFLPSWICAQKWQNLQTFGGSGNENPGDLYCNSEGHCAAGFTFQGKMELGGRTLNSQGGSDFVILQRPKGSAQYRYFSHGGGPLDEEIVAVRPLSNGGLLCTGVFWRELVLPDTTLFALDAGKAIFVLSYLPSGRLSWAKVIDGSGLKSVSDVLLNDNGNIWVSGSFSDTLFVEGKKWAAAGQSDLFLLRLEADGRLQWLQHHGVTGSTRLAGIAELPGRAVVGLGSFDKSVQFGNDIFAANTSDQDLFITAWGPDGQVLWARKGGGVYDATPIDITTDDKGGIYFCGNIVGVIRFDNGRQHILGFSNENIGNTARQVGLCLEIIIDVSKRNSRFRSDVGKACHGEAPSPEQAGSCGNKDIAFVVPPGHRTAFDYQLFN